jgi:hypothetical protein
MLSVNTLKHNNDPNNCVFDHIGSKNYTNEHDSQENNDNYNINPKEYDHILKGHPVGISMVPDNTYNGFDYNGFSNGLSNGLPNILPHGLVNILDNNKDIYDPYLQYLHKNGLDGRGLSRYTINRINIDSRNRNKQTTAKIKHTIKLDTDPMTFNGSLLKINISDTDKFRTNDKIIINGVLEKEITIRSIVSDDFGNNINYFLVDEGKQYMTVCADNNMQINTQFTPEIKDIYTDLAVEFSGFIGDKKTEWYFDTKNFMWEILPNTYSADKSISTWRLKISEDVLSVCNHPEPEKRFKTHMLVADFVIDNYGMVIEINSGESNGMPYESNDVFWQNSSNMTGELQGIPDNYYKESKITLLSLGLINPPIVPTTIYKTMEYFDKVQNTIRHIFLQSMATSVPNFSICYKNANKSYPTHVRIVIPEATKVSYTNMMGNIPVGSLNSQHRMYLTNYDIEHDIEHDNEYNIGINNIINTTTSNITDAPIENKFYVKLNNPYCKKRFEFSNPFMSGALMIKIYEDSVSDVTIKYKHAGGVPLNLINSDYPTGFNTINGYKYIQDIINVSDIGKHSYIIVELDRIGFINKNFGGDNVYISLINDIDQGYQNPNKYVIDLERMYNNIVMIRMISSCFPKSQNLIMDGLSGGKKNNRFYWQNIDDGNIVYNIEIPSGNYTHTEFKNIFECSVNKIARICNDNHVYAINHIMLDIDSKSEKVTFTSYNKYVYNGTNVFVKYSKLSTINQMRTISSMMDPEDAYYQYPTGTYFKLFPHVYTSFDYIKITIYHPNNKLKVNDRILITNSLNFRNIHAKYLNGTHIVTRVSLDYYDILLSNINLDTTLNTANAGGEEIIIYTPNIFRIRFDYQYTFGKILGFRNVGEYTSITPYYSIITNNTPYEYENININNTHHISNISIDESINCESINNAFVHEPLEFDGPQYILMTCSQIPCSNSLGRIKDYFYRINLCGRQNTYIYDSYVKSSIIFNDPLDHLSELNLNFYSPDGSYYDFNGRDHSFVLELTCYNEVPEGTNIST